MSQINPETLLLVVVGGAAAWYWIKHRNQPAATIEQAAAPSRPAFVEFTPYSRSDFPSADTKPAPVQISSLTNDDALAFEYFSRVEKRFGLLARLDFEQKILDLQNHELQQRKAAVPSTEKKAV